MSTACSETDPTNGFWTEAGHDEIELVRWVPGILPAFANLIDMDPKSVRDLPGWLKFPVNTTTGIVIQPAFEFLAAMARTRGAKSRGTCDAYAYDLRSWFEFLAMEQVAWHEANQSHLDEFIADMACAELAEDFGSDASPASRGGASDGRDLGLTASTIRRRVEAVISFYGHARPSGPAFDRRSARKVGRRAQELVRPIPFEDLGDFQKGLGPKPSEWTGEGSSRLWCCCSIALTAGLRRMEVCGLDVEQILALDPEPAEPNRPHIMRLRVTKGGRPRNAELPGWLVEELHAYVRGERSVGGEVTEGPLFVNHLHARRSPLERLTPATLSFDFRNAMRARDLRRRNVAFRYGTGTSERLHSFHDLRHTCACLVYLTHADTADPWVLVQSRLGHKLLKTTTDVYLRHLDEMRGRGFDPRHSLVSGMLSS